MGDVDRRAHSSGSAASRLWQRVPLVVRAVVSGILVSGIGVYGWLAVGALQPGLWSLVVMGGLLWLYWKYLSGSWWPVSTAEARRRSFRAGRMSTVVSKWSLVAAILIVLIWQSGMVLTFRVIEFPAEEFTAGYDLDAIPPRLAWLVVIMSSLVAGICEETGYRGYTQVPLEERYGPAAAITISSVVFLGIHFQQIWAPPVLFHLLSLGLLLGILAYASGSLVPGMVAHMGLDIFNFSYWWTDLAGAFDKRPISETGIDGHFLMWLTIFVASVVAFAWTAGKTLAARRQTPVVEEATGRETGGK